MTAPTRLNGAVRRRRWAILVVASALLALGGSSASAEEAEALETAEPGQTASGDHTAISPWTCDEGDQPQILTPDVVAPSLPFRGVVYAVIERNADTKINSLIIRFHNTVSRTNTEIIVEGLGWSHPLSIDRTATGLVIDTALSVAESCTLAQADSALEIDDWLASRATITIPWGRTTRLEAAAAPASDPIATTGIESAAHSFSDGLASERFGLGTHANGVHIEAGDQVGAYVLTHGGTEPPSRLELYGDHRSWSLNDDAFLLGTDGELLAFAIWPFEPAWAGHEITVISMRTGEVVACGYGEFGTFQLFAPAEGGLVVPEIKLPPSGWLNVLHQTAGDGDCPRNIDGSFFDYLASQPVPPSPKAVPTPRPVDLPSTRAPESPFGGIVRTFDRYDPARYVHDQIVQYYDSGSGEVTEIVFDGKIGSRLGVARLDDDGIVFDRASGTSVLIRWGSAPELVPAERLGHRDKAVRQLGLALAHAEAAADPDSASPCVSDSLDVGGLTATATLQRAHYGDRWNQPKLLEVTIGDVHESYLLAAPVEDLTDVVDVATTCLAPTYAAGLTEYPPRLLGSDGLVLMLSYTYIEGDEFYGGPGTDLTYVISLNNGEILTCGIEPNSRNVIFVASGESASVPKAPVLPPSGWLDPQPCAGDDPTVTPEQCTSIFVRHGDNSVCARELDFRSIGQSKPGVAPTPATIE